MSAFYVYALIDPRSGEPFYVGKGRGKRRFHHEQEARGTGDSAKLGRIRDIWSVGLAVGHQFLATGLSEPDALALERETITRLRATLTNVAPGGGPLSVSPEEQFRLMAIQARCRAAFLDAAPAMVPRLRKMLRDHLDRRAAAGKPPNLRDKEVQTILRVLRMAAAA